MRKVIVAGDQSNGAIYNFEESVLNLVKHLVGIKHVISATWYESKWSNDKEEYIIKIDTALSKLDLEQLTKEKTFMSIQPVAFSRGKSYLSLHFKY